MEYVKVKDHNNLVRDPKTNAIINNNKHEYDEYIKRRNKNLSEKERVENLENDVKVMKSDLNEIKDLLKHLIKGSD